jgi:hypothetical protein
MAPRPDSPVLDRLLDPVARSLTPEAARALVALRADPEAQARIEELADKCNEGRLTPAERAEYEAAVHASTFIAILQAKARALLKNNARR